MANRRNVPHDWEVERAIAAAVVLASRGIHPSREAVAIVSGMPVNLARVARTRAISDGSWPVPATMMESKLRKAEAGELSRIAREADFPERSTEYTFERADDPTVAEIATRAAEERQRLGHFFEARLPHRKPDRRRSNAQWCRLYLKEWRRRTGRTRSRPRRQPGEAA